MHQNNKCTPCLFFEKNSGCLNGLYCPFCHNEHTKKKKERPSKQERQNIKKIIDDLLKENSYDSYQELRLLASQNSYAYKLLQEII